MLVTVHVSCTETACCEQVVDLRKRPEYIQMDIIIYQPFNVCLVTFVCVFSCFHTAGCEACSFTTDRYGIFNVRTYSGLCSIHDGGSGTYTSAQELPRRDQKTCTLPCPARGSNPGSSDLTCVC